MVQGLVLVFFPHFLVLVAFKKKIFFVSRLCQYPLKASFSFFSTFFDLFYRF